MSKIGTKIDQLHKLREQKRELEEKIKDLTTAMDKIENELMAQMDSEGVTKSTGSLATVSITTSVKPQVEDWDAFYKYINRTKYNHLLERRPSVTGCRELFESKGKIPGVVPFTQRKLLIRSV